MTLIIDLPVYHILPIIFKELSIQDLLNFRLVNKLFKNLSENINGINKLIIGQPCLGVDDHYWYYNLKSIEDKNIISLKFFRAINKSKIFNLEQNLKYLKIYDQEFELKEISNLINLESIEFGNSYQNDNQQILNFNNLKVFVSNRYSIQLNTPKLVKIKFYDINKIKLNSNPELIKHLITCNYDNKLDIFKNLETLELRDNFQPIDDNLLIIFKNLKQLKINWNCDSSNYPNEQLTNDLRKILNDKIKLKRSIDIYLKGIKIENINKLNELVSTGYVDWRFRLNNYDLLDLNLSFIKKLNYEDLEECVNNIKDDLPSSFFDKFIHINHVIVDSVNDIDGLNWFINKLKYLTRLVIINRVSLGDVFYNNLPNSIRELYIYDRDNINYEFILKLSKLNEFITRVDNDLFDLAITSFLNLKYLKRFEFIYEKRRIEILKREKCFHLNHIELNFDQLIDECNKIRSV